MYALRKYERVPGSFKEHLFVRTFRYQDDMYKFLAKGDNALRWRGVTADMPIRAGRYTFMGGMWVDARGMTPAGLLP